MKLVVNHAKILQDALDNAYIKFNFFYSNQLESVFFGNCNILQIIASDLCFAFHFAKCFILLLFHFIHCLDAVCHI